jgi:hypothetical protein
MITDDFLLRIFDEKAGIFSADTSSIVQEFNLEVQRLRDIPNPPGNFHFTNLDFGISPISFGILSSNISEFQALNPTFTHLIINYGLVNAGATRKFVLVFRGVKLDPGVNGKNLRKFIDASNSSNLYFTTNSTSLVSDNNFRPIVKEFSDVFSRVYGQNKFVTAAFIRFQDFKEKLTLLNPTSLPPNNHKLVFDLGFMKSKDNDPFLPKFQCFHLVFRSDSGLSPIFSTFDGDTNYSGPKPGSPPLSSGPTM